MGENKASKRLDSSYSSSSSGLQTALTKVHYPPIVSPVSESEGGGRPKRREKKAQEVLFGLLEHYLQNGKPVGSQTLKEAGFGHLSSATIRNYFSYLEKEGLLKQVHSSGGRLPTDAAWRLYVDAHPAMALTQEKALQWGEHFSFVENEPLFQALERCCQKLSDYLQQSCFLIPPSFSHDQPWQIKIWQVSSSRLLSVSISQLGFIRHDSFNISLKKGQELAKIERSIEEKIRNPFSIGKIQLSSCEEETAQTLYNEIMIRHLLDLQKEKKSSIFTTGLSKLVEQSDSDSTKHLLTALHFFESSRVKEKLLACSDAHKRACVYIGEETKELFFNSDQSTQCSVFVAPLLLGSRSIGVLGALTPKRIDYAEILQYIDYASTTISSYLTRSYYTHQIPQNIAVDTPRYS